jgi:hypothetical protein
MSNSHTFHRYYPFALPQWAHENSRILCPHG